MLYLQIITKTDQSIHWTKYYCKECIIQNKSTRDYYILSILLSCYHDYANKDLSPMILLRFFILLRIIFYEDLSVTIQQINTINSFHFYMIGQNQTIHLILFKAYVRFFKSEDILMMHCSSHTWLNQSSMVRESD